MGSKTGLDTVVIRKLYKEIKHSFQCLKYCSLSSNEERNLFVLENVQVSNSRTVSTDTIVKLGYIFIPPVHFLCSWTTLLCFSKHFSTY